MGESDLDHIATGLFRENRYTVNNLFKGDHDLTQLQRALVSFAAGSLPNLAELELYAKAVTIAGERAAPKQ